MKRRAKRNTMAQPLPHRWSLEHNALSGLTLGRWLTLLRENRFDVDIAYAHRAMFLTAMGVFNSTCHAIERLRYGRAIRAATVRPDPIFILGHWRSGTTHLHNLLACDPRLASPTTFAVVNPFSFLCTERVLPRLFAPLLPAMRPMDNMAVTFRSPQEDEIALSMLTGMSPYLSLSFPRRAVHYDRYLTFDDASRDEIERWQRAFMHFARKLSVREPRQLVFKSPGHTARIRLLLELFPEARFVHIHRDPLTVFQSSRHYFDTAAWYMNLQVADRSALDDAILRRYTTLYDAYLAQRSLIPPGRLHELSFASLDADPIAQLRHLYDGLQLEGFDEMQPALAAYLGTLEGYQKNRHDTLNEADRLRVEKAWEPYFEAFGYVTRRTEPAAPPARKAVRV